MKVTKVGHEEFRVRYQRSVVVVWFFGHWHFWKNLWSVKCVAFFKMESVQRIEHTVYTSMFEIWHHYFHKSKPQGAWKKNMHGNDLWWSYAITTTWLSLTEPSSSILRNSTQALQEINLSGWKWRGEHLFFSGRWVLQTMESTSIPSKFPPKKNKDLCLNEWLLRISEVHPINCYNESRNHRLEHGTTPAIWLLGPPAEKKTSPTKQSSLAGDTDFFTAKNDSLSPSSWGSALEFFCSTTPDIRRWKATSVLRTRRAAGPAFCLRSPSRKTAQRYLQWSLLHPKHLKDADDLGCHISSDSSRG